MVSHIFVVRFTFFRALELRPNFVRAHANLGIAFANQGLHQEVFQSYKPFIESPDVHNCCAFLRFRLPLRI